MLEARPFVTLERCAGSGDGGFTLLGLWMRVRNLENLVCEDVWKGQPGVLVCEVRIGIKALLWKHWTERPWLWVPLSPPPNILTRVHLQSVVAHVPGVLQSEWL